MDFAKGDTVIVEDKSGAMQFGTVRTNYKTLPGNITGYIVDLLSNGKALYVREDEIKKAW